MGPTMTDVGNAASAQSTDTATAAATTQQWRCDVCKVRFFEDFDEACAREAECQSILDAKAKAKQAITAAMALASKTETETATSFAPTLVTQDTIENEDKATAAATATS